jgi:uncharacterized membrane protein SirB2
MQAFPISPDRMRDATDVARMRMVYGALPRNSPILLLTALVLLWLMRESIPFAQAALWFGALLLVTVIRLLLARIYLRATDGAEARRFENYWASLTLLTGLVWSWFFRDAGHGQRRNRAHYRRRART